MRWTPLFVLLSLAVPGGVTAQQQAGSTATSASSGEGSSVLHGVAHYGKWFAGIAAVTLTYLGAKEHDRSDDAWSDLLEICNLNQADCALGGNNRYINPNAERLYSASLRFDDRARVRMLGGQVALLLAVGLFVLDMPHDDDGPENIPLEPLSVSSNLQTGDTRVGVSFNF